MNYASSIAAGRTQLFASGQRAPTLGDELRQLIAVFTSGWRLIAAALGLALLAGLAYVVITPPRYVAETQLLLEPRQSRIVEGRVVDTGLGSSAIGTDLLLLDTQLQVIRSESVARLLISLEGLDADPEFVGSPGLLAQLRGTLSGLIGTPAAAPGTPYDELLAEIGKRLTVWREANTYVVGISFKSEDPAKAARLANRVASIYIAQNTGAAQASTEAAASALDGRLADLRASANATAQAVEAYRRDKGLTSSDNLLVIEQQLNDLNNQLSLARVARIDAEANLVQVRRALDTSNTAGLTAASLQSEVLSALQVQMTTLQVEEAGLAARYFPGHPAFREITDKKAALSAALGAEFGRIIERLQLQADMAAQKEQSLTAQVARLETARADLDVASVQLAELEREAAASQAVYETFLNRSKQVNEQVGLPDTTARVISQAFAPSRPSEPKTLLVLAAALALGLLFGSALAWLAYLLAPARQPQADVPLTPNPLSHHPRMSS